MDSNKNFFHFFTTIAKVIRVFFTNSTTSYMFFFVFYILTKKRAKIFFHVIMNWNNILAPFIKKKNPNFGRVNINGRTPHIG